MARFETDNGEALGVAVPISRLFRAERFKLLQLQRSRSPCKKSLALEAPKKHPAADRSGRHDRVAAFAAIRKMQYQP
jgi:hypothetical protein